MRALGAVLGAVVGFGLGAAFWAAIGAELTTATVVLLGELTPKARRVFEQAAIELHENFLRK